MNRKHKYVSVRMKSEQVKELVRQNFEPGRQDKCLIQVYRNVIKPATGISERTYWRYLNEIEAETKPEEDPNQLKLFED